jgi:hypothetical protein
MHVAAQTHPVSRPAPDRYRATAGASRRSNPLGAVLARPGRFLESGQSRRSSRREPMASLAKMCARWVSTVLTEMNRDRAISTLVDPLAARSATRSSCGVRPGERVASEARLRELRQTDPGGLVIIHVLDDDDPVDRALLLRALLVPDTVVASDAMPLTGRWQSAVCSRPGCCKTGFPPWLSRAGYRKRATPTSSSSTGHHQRPGDLRRQHPPVGRNTARAGQRHLHRPGQPAHHQRAARSARPRCPPVRRVLCSCCRLVLALGE